MHFQIVKQRQKPIELKMLIDLLIDEESISLCGQGKQFNKQ